MMNAKQKAIIESAQLTEKVNAIMAIAKAK